MGLSKQDIKKIYCIAICGMGMGSLAGLLKAAGYEVSGSDDHVYPPMSDQLRQQGIQLFEGYSAENVPEDADLVIIGNAVSKGHVEVNEVEARNLPYLSMADAVAEFFLEGKQSLVVAGTHGKTTTSSLLAWLLTGCEQDPGFLIGGVLGNFAQSWRWGEGPYFVVEGDEYDTAFFDKTPKFLHYRPNIGILNAVEFDHADIYEDLDAVMDAFQKFVELIPANGRLVACVDSENVRSLVQAARCPVTTFGELKEADYRLLNLEIDSHGSLVRFKDPEGQERVLHSPMVGRHNALNLLAVLAVLEQLGLKFDMIQTALEEFKGIKRRQEIRGVVRGVTVIDDFAHHPTAVRETLQALKQQYPGQRLWAVFEPRSNTSRRNIFQDEFASALAEADQVLVATPFDNGKIPADELMDVHSVVSQITDQGSPAFTYQDVDDIVGHLIREAQHGDVIAVLSNGGFGGIHEKLLKELSQAHES